MTQSNINDEEKAILKLINDAHDLVYQDGQGDHWGKEGIKLLKDGAEKFGADTLVHALQSRIGDDLPEFDTFFYVFSRAGIKEIEPLVKELFEIPDADCKTSAAVCLAHLGVDEGIEFIEGAFSGEYDDLLEESPWWYFDEYIQEIDDPRIKKVVEDYQ